MFSFLYNLWSFHEHKRKLHGKMTRWMWKTFPPAVFCRVLPFNQPRVILSCHRQQHKTQNHKQNYTVYRIQHTLHPTEGRKKEKERKKSSARHKTKINLSRVKLDRNQQQQYNSVWPQKSQSFHWIITEKYVVCILHSWKLNATIFPPPDSWEQYKDM